MIGQDFQNQFKLSSDNYLAKNHIMEYLNDSVQQMLDLRNSNPKLDVLDFFTEYFKSVKQGTHILFREYNFIIATPHNRACFIEKVLETYISMLEKEEALKTCDFHALILLLCPDFPLEIVEKSLRMICNEDNLSAYFKDFIYAFQFQFYYKEFSKQTRQIFDNYQTKNESTLSSLHSSINLKNTMNKKKFLESLENLSHQVNYSFPPKPILKEVLKNKSEVNHEEFILELARNEKLTLEIGKLPTKSQLNEYQAKRFIKLEEIPVEKKVAIESPVVIASEPQKLPGSKSKKSINSHGNKYPSDNESRSTSSESSSESDT